MNASRATSFSVRKREPELDTIWALQATPICCYTGCASQLAIGTSCWREPTGTCRAPRQSLRRLRLGLEEPDTRQKVRVCHLKLCLALRMARFTREHSINPSLSRLIPRSTLSLLSPPILRPHRSPVMAALLLRIPPRHMLHILRTRSQTMDNQKTDACRV